MGHIAWAGWTGPVTDILGSGDRALKLIRTTPGSPYEHLFPALPRCLILAAAAPVEEGK
ncbi:MAG: hypothetical protein ACYCYK_01585 [Candidatus Dormibacteria bacterium]